MVANATRLCGTFNASTGAIDDGSNTLTSVANTKGDLYLCDTAGTYLGTAFEVGDSLFFKNSVAANTAPTANDVFSVEATVTVSNANANLSWGTTTTIATVEGVDITVTMPNDPTDGAFEAIGATLTDLDSRINIIDDMVADNSSALIDHNTRITAAEENISNFPFEAIAAALNDITSRLDIIDDMVADLQSDVMTLKSANS